MIGYKKRIAAAMGIFLSMVAISKAGRAGDGTLPFKWAGYIQSSTGESVPLFLNLKSQSHLAALADEVGCISDLGFESGYFTEGSLSIDKQKNLEIDIREFKVTGYCFDDVQSKRADFVLFDAEGGVHHLVGKIQNRRHRTIFNGSFLGYSVMISTELGTNGNYR